MCLEEMSRLQDETLPLILLSSLFDAFGGRGECLVKQSLDCHVVHKSIEMREQEAAELHFSRTAVLTS